MKKLVFSLLLIIFVCLTLSACSDYDEDYVYDGKALVGKWQEKDFDEGFYKIYDFKADGTVTYTYYTYGIIFDTEYGVSTQKYRVEGNNTLVITQEYNGKDIDTEVNFSINEKGILVMSSDGEDVNTMEPYRLDYDEQSPLLGKWVDKNVVNGVEQTDLFWFSADSECYIFPNVSGKIGDDVDEFIEDYVNSETGFIDTMLYSTKGERIYLCFADDTIISGESVVFGEYKIEGDKLVIKSEGEIIVELERYVK